MREGFHIVDWKERPKERVEVKNCRSAYDDVLRPLAEQQIKMELEEGRYCIVSDPPSIVSAIGVLPKPEGQGVRLIHDCSRPAGASVNDYAPLERVSFQTFDDAVKLLTPGCYLAKVDLKNAFRSVKVHPSNRDALGLKWVFAGDKEATYLIDTCMPFGARRAPSIFHRISQSIKRMMRRRGFDCIVVYLDDFLVVAKTLEECSKIQAILIDLLRKLGFQINWKKVEGPATCLTFLGVEIDTVAGTLQLPERKLNELKEVLQSFTRRKRASRKQLQSLAGKLNWACQVIRGGRTFLRRIIDSYVGGGDAGGKRRLSREFYADVRWWLEALQRFHGKAVFPHAKPIVDAHVDSSKQAAGLFFRGDWQYVDWSRDWPIMSDLHINYKEVLSIALSLKRWAHLWRNSKVIVYTDSQVARAIINRGSCHHPGVMTVLRQLFWITVDMNIELQAVFIPGKTNDIPDAISRIHQPGQWRRLEGLLREWWSARDVHGVQYRLINHISKDTLFHLFYRPFGCDSVATSTSA